MGQSNQNQEEATKPAEDAKKAQSNNSAKPQKPADLTHDELVEKARTDYGIVNATDMNDKQLKAEMKAIDDQAKTAESDGQSTPAQPEE